MTVDDDGTVSLTEAEAADLIVCELRRRDLVAPGAMYYVRFRVVPEGTFVIVPGGADLSVVVTVEEKAH